MVDEKALEAAVTWAAEQLAEGKQFLKHFGVEQIIKAYEFARTPPATEQKLRESLEEVLACFDAACAEGLLEKLEGEENRDFGSLYDLITRRVLHAKYTADQALALLPTHRPERASIVVGPAYFTDKVLPDEAMAALTKGEAQTEDYGMIRLPDLHREAVPMTEAEMEGVVRKMRLAWCRGVTWEIGDPMANTPGSGDYFAKKGMRAVLAAIEQHYTLVRKA